jgi:predicted phosphate transport protein (TIGR00153 family)
VLRSIIPRDEAFFTGFEQLCLCVTEGAELLETMLRDGASAQAEQGRALKAVEERGDDVVHGTLEHLHRTFVTPLDREDIHRLVTVLDDILDLSEGAGARLVLYRPRTPLPEAESLGRVLVRATRCLQEMVGLLRRLRSPERILELAVEINRLENEGDAICRATFGRLLQDLDDPFEFIKWKEIVDMVEEAVDRCEDVSDLIEGVVLEST